MSSAKAETTQASASAPTRDEADELASRLTRTEVRRHALSVAGREIVQVLTQIPCGVESGWHIHPGEEVGYILACTVSMMIAVQPTLTLNEGDGFLIKPRHPHNALDIGPAEGQMLSTYIVDGNEPVSTFVDPPT